MGTPQVRMADGTVRLIREECSRHPTTETGGVLLGHSDPLSPDTLLHVVAATGPGPNASHSPGQFSPDVDDCNRQIQLLCKADDRLRYCGSWHTHPRFMPVPSSQDLRQAQQILADPDYELDSVIVMIATGPNADLRAFVLHKRERNFEEAHMESQVQTQNVLDVADELHRLDLAGWRPETRRSPNGDLVVRAIRRDSETTLNFVVPRDYPASKPEILAQTRVAWPPDAGHLDDAARAITGSNARSRARTASGVLDALRPHGISASFLGEKDGVQTYALARPGRPTAGFLVLPAFPGQPEVYDAQMNRCHLRDSAQTQTWAREAVSALGVQPGNERWQWLAVVLVALATIIALAHFAIGLGGTQDNPTPTTPNAIITDGGAR